MNISKPAVKKSWESPTDYVGKLPATGKGVGVVVMDEGFDTTHPDLKDSVKATVATAAGDRFDHDPVGHGTLVAGIIGGDGTSSDGQIKGVAPDADLIAVKVQLGEKSGSKAAASVAAGIDWAVKNKDEFNIKVINCSFVLPLALDVDPTTQMVKARFDPLGYALNQAKEAGILVVAGAGNFGDKMDIATPAGNSSVIAVGALDSMGTPEDKSDDQVWELSSRGLSLEGKPKPDILAPGVRVMSANAAGSSFEQRNAHNLKFAKAALEGSPDLLQKLARNRVEKGALSPLALQLPEPELRKAVVRCFDVKPTLGENGEHPAYIAQDGSSEAAPIVTGTIAAMYEANPDLTPDEVKEILYSTADPVKGDKMAVGRGALDAQEAVAEALRRKKG